MSTTLSHSLPQAPVQGTPIAANLVAVLRKAGRSIWRGLETMGYMRARRELTFLAAQYEFTRPELAAQLRAAAAQTPQH